MSRRLVLAIGLLALLLGAACSQGRAPAPPSSPPSSTEATNSQQQSTPRASTSGGATNPSRPAGSAPAAPPDAAAQNQALPGLDRLIIRQVSLLLAVPNTLEAYRQVEQIAADQGGFVAASQFRQEGERTTGASITLRVPADNRAYQATLDRLRGLAERVIEEKGDVQDVTEEHVDLESRLRNLQATERSLLTLYDKANRMEEIFAVQREITTVRGQIEQAEGRKRALERRSAMATITVQLRETTPAVSPRQREWSSMEVVVEAYDAFMVVVRRLATAAIWLVIWLPLYGLPLLGLWLLRGRLRALAR
jgi:hypothetical protein